MKCNPCNFCGLCNKTCHLLMIPFTGLGLYSGFRGNTWLRNRIRIFEQFVIPSLLNQTNKGFIVWIAWRKEEKENKIVKSFIKRLNKLDLTFVHTWSGCPFYDDKYPDKEARKRLFDTIKGLKLGKVTEGADYVLMTIQPSDDIYHKRAVEEIQREIQDVDAVGFSKGYIANYLTKEISEYDPKTNPPFYTIKFKRSDFINSRLHIKHTRLKKDVGKYKKGTPLPSHEYVGDCLKYKQLDWRGFLVGCHTKNISTYYGHRFKGKKVSKKCFKDFSAYNTPVLKLI